MHIREIGVTCEPVSLYLIREGIYMRLKRLIDGLARKRSGLALLTGMTLVLEGVERLMSTHRPVAPIAPRPVVLRQRTDYFSIKRSKSDFGFTYWVLQGHGYFASFALFDTWREAMDEANQRIALAAPVARVEQREYAAV
jgi:hypothetical protein